MEIKWGPIKGKFSLQKHLKRLAAHHTKQLKKAFQQCALPSEWANSLGAFQKAGFKWKAETSNGRGVILFCPVCRNATLIQFFDQGSRKTDRISINMLKSFRDHRNSGHTLWAVYDIRAVIPDRFNLAHHQFKPGNFHLTFTSGRQNLHLFRWAPASAFLSKINLAQFAKISLGLDDDHLESFNTQGYETVEWKSAPKGGWLGYTGRLKGANNFQWIRLWVLQEKNRIVGIKVDDKRPLDQSMIKDICSTYEIL